MKSVGLRINRKEGNVRFVIARIIAASAERTVNFEQNLIYLEARARARDSLTDIFLRVLHAPLRS